ncbi:MAG: ATP-binding protein [Flavobacteriales bacterium]|nr:ATP-binding protein [Flavobacteriales bacterium]
MDFHSSQISYFAQCDWRTDDRVFGIKQADRMFGIYIVGKTGAGKTNLLTTLVKQDFVYQRGICVIDIHGDLIKHLISSFPSNQRQDLLILDASDPNLTWGYNPLRKVATEYRHLISSHIIESFSLLWGQQAWGVKLEHILRNVVLSLLDQPKADLGGISKILTNREFRDACLPYIESEEVRNFWKLEFPKFTKTDLLPVLNKVGSFVTIPTLRKILIENQDQLSISDIMNNEKVLLVNLAKGSIGSDASRLLGSLLLNTISSAGFNRVTIPEKDRKPFYVYLDEFHNFTTESLINMFAEHRKFRIAYIVAHQYLKQISEPIRESVMGNIGTIISFRLSFQDGKRMANELYPDFSAHDFVKLENYHIYLKMMIDGKPSKPFSAKTIQV